MATYEQIAVQLENNPTAFQRKLRIAILKAAQFIRAEDGGTANHAQRLQWADAALANPPRTSLENMADLMLLDALADPGASDPDATADATVDAIVAALVGSAPHLTRYLA